MEVLKVKRQVYSIVLSILMILSTITLGNISNIKANDTVDLKNYVNSLIIKDKEGNIVNENVKLNEGVNLEANLKWNIPGNVYKTNKVYTYKLPSQFKISHNIVENITQGKDVVGSFTVSTDGLITVTYNNDYNKDNNNVINEMGIKGVSKHVGSEAESKGEFNYQAGSETIVVVNDGDFNVSKKVTKKYENDQLSKDSVLEYTVTITSGNGTYGDFTIEDTLKSEGDLTYNYDKNSFKLTLNNSEVNITPEINNQTFTIKNVSALNKGEKYVLKYNVNVSRNAGANTNATLTNKVIVKNNDKQKEDSQTVTYNNVLKKEYMSYNTDGARWKTRIYTQGTSLAKFKVTDTATEKIKQVLQSGSSPIIVAGYKSNGTNVHWANYDNSKIEYSNDGKTFTITMPENNGFKYQDVAYWDIFYYTEVTFDNNTDKEIINTIKLINTTTNEEWKDSATTTIGKKPTGYVKKSAVGKEVLDDGNIKAYWKFNIEYNNIGNTVEITDYIQKATWASKDYIQSHHSYANIIKSELENENTGIKITFDENGVTKTYTINEARNNGYTVTLRYLKYNNGQWVEVKEDSLEKVKQFRIRITSKTGSTIKNVKIDKYSSILSNQDFKQGDLWKISNQVWLENLNFGSTAYQEYQVPVNSVDKRVKVNNNYVKDATVDYKNTNGKLTYKLVVDATNKETIKIEDILPEGVTLNITNNTFKSGNLIISPLSDNNTLASTNNHWSDANRRNNIKASINDNKLTIELSNVGSSLSLRNNKLIGIEYTVTLPKDLKTVSNAKSDSYHTTASFKNKVTVDNVSSTTTTTVSQSGEILSKKGIQVKDENGNISSKVKYEVIINSDAIDLEKNSNTLKLIDTIESTNLNFELTSDSVKLYELTSDNQKGNEVTLTKVDVKAAETDENGVIKQTFEMEVPDEKALILEYTYNVDSTTNESTSGVLKNTAELSGIIKTNTNDKVEGIVAWARSNNGSLKLTKVDKDNNLIYLDNAYFKLEAYNKEKDEFELIEDNIKVSGSEGYVFDYYNNYSKLKGNTLYRITETKAPEGYKLSKEAKYFIIKGDITNFNTLDTISDEEAINKAYGNKEVITKNKIKVENVKLCNANTSTHIDYENKIDEKISIKVNKVWKGEEAKEVKVNVKANNKIVDTYTLTKEDNWTHTFENLSKYDDNDKEIKYSIEEENIEGYQSKITGNITDGYTITNTRVGKKDIKVTKTWENDTKENRPSQITVRLYANDKEVNKVNITSNDNWTYTFKDLDAYDNEGKEINYTISEDKVDSYTTTINEYSIINTYNKKKENINKKENKVVKTGDNSNIIIYVSLFVLSLLIILIIKRKQII